MSKLILDWNSASDLLVECAEYFLGTLHPDLQILPQQPLTNVYLHTEKLFTSFPTYYQDKHRALFDYVCTMNSPRRLGITEIALWQHLLQDMPDLNRYYYQNNVLLPTQDVFWWILPVMSTATTITDESHDTLPQSCFVKLFQIYSYLGYGSHRTTSDRCSDIIALFMCIFDQPWKTQEYQLWMYKFSKFFLWAKALSIGYSPHSGMYRYQCNKNLRHWNCKKREVL